MTDDAKLLPFIIACVATLAALLGALWYIPKWQVRPLRAVQKPDELFAAENEARKTVAQILGGVFVLASVYVAWENFDNARRTSDLTLQNAAASQLTDRFTRAIGQLESANREVVCLRQACVI
jgi:hypothetical protein